MNHFVDIHSRKRKFVPCAEPNDSYKRPKMTAVLPSKFSPNRTFQTSTDLSKKAIFQNHYNSQCWIEEKLGNDQFQIKASTRQALYDKYKKEMSNYQSLVSSTQGLKFSQCCPKEK